MSGQARSGAEPGLVIVDKPAGMTSHDVVGRCRRLFGTRKVGHAGTLDPMATGVLVIGIERATKILGLLTATDKSYAATIRLGRTTTTEDAEGEVVEDVPARRVTDEQIHAAVADLRGDIEQVPSAVSAIKVGGQRAYKLAREGQSVELAARPVRIDRFDVLDIRRPDDFPDFVDVESRWTARRAPISGRWPATSVRRSAWAGTSRCCAVRASAGTASTRPIRSTNLPSTRN